MKVLVTGATGFIGSHLVKALLKAGHQVIIFKRSFSDTWRIVEVLTQLYAYDLDQCKIEQPFQDHGKIDAVIHTATCYGRNGESVSCVFDANTAFPLRLLETAIGFNTPTFVNTDTFSGTGVYNYLKNYHLSKKHFLEWGKHLASLDKIRFLNIKLQHIYGPGDSDTKFTVQVIKSCLQNVPELKLTAGEQKRDFVFMSDVVNAYLQLLGGCQTRGENFQEYELGSGNPVTIREFVELVQRITQSNTVLKFGALPYRDYEIMEPQANLEALQALGWSGQVSLASGIKAIIYEDGKRWRE